MPFVRRATAIAIALVCAAVTVPLTRVTASAATAIAAADLGSTAATAAGSCWEIKQVRPTAADGAYWLLTPAMSEPKQLYCDMTTDGGGWVLVGKGRDGWSDDYLGKGSEAELRTPATAPMSSTTHELSSRLVDQLLDGGRVDALADGIRLRRATNTAGTTWQETRVKLANRDRWVWSFGAEHPLTSFSFDGSSGSGGSTSSFGSDNNYRRVVSTPQSANGYKYGFAFGSRITGSTSATSYLFSGTAGAGYALPYTLVYLRPKVLSTSPAFTAIPDSGRSGWTRPAVPRSAALPASWGVSGTAGSTAEEGNVEVQAFTQSGRRMYVGGNFRYVQQDDAGTGRVEQPFLAAFDVDTGEWVPSFRPVLNEQVRTLATLPNGQVVAGGDFTQANGQAATSVVALDPDTGATSGSWKVTVENRVTGATLRVNAITVADGQVYIGGNLTHVAGGTRPATFSYMRMLGRVSAADGTPSTSWNPNLNGAVAAVDGSADGTRVYAAGYFTAANGIAAKNAAALQTAPGAALVTPAWSPTWSATKSYQQAIEEVGGSVFVGGSEHSLFQFDTSTFARTSGSILKTHGDVQAITAAGGVVYAGCHCDGWSYQNAYTWPTLGAGWTQGDAMRWFGAWSAQTGARIPDFTPTFNMRLNQGIWALAADSNGTVWAGGDIATVATPAKQAAWSGGFARFPLVDSTAPAVPSNLKVAALGSTTVTLSWNGVTDAGGGVRYQVLRDDRPVGMTDANTPTLTVPLGGDNRFFVRAVDAAENYSATTPVVRVGAGNAPPTAAMQASADRLTVDVDASASADSDGTVDAYAWSFGDGATAAGVAATHAYAAAGTYTVTLTVTDNAGATASATQQVTVSLPAGESVVIDRGAAWRWKYDSAAVGAGWTGRDFDDSSWRTGNGVLGFGGTVATDINTFATTAQRPLTAYFRRSFEVPGAQAAVRLVLETVADDGVVVYVNGTEVGRSNMPAGPITASTYASSARRSTVAGAAPYVVEVPVGLLVDGTNVIAAETHLNYRGTPDASFDLKATLTSNG